MKTQWLEDSEVQTAEWKVKLGDRTWYTISATSFAMSVLEEDPEIYDTEWYVEITSEEGFAIKFEASSQYDFPLEYNEVVGAFCAKMNFIGLGILSNLHCQDYNNKGAE